MSPNVSRSKGGKRAYRKSTNGCKTCKIRRVKCDETQPACLRCKSTGRRCDGYDIEKGALQRFQNDLPLATVISIVPGNASDRERRAFDFYLNCTAPSISGPSGADFWQTVVPKLCHSQPAVWDAVIAISTLIEHPQYQDHPMVEPRRKTPVVDVSYRWALGLYNRSITRMTDMSVPDATVSCVAIITCILFICIEFLQDNFSRSLALFHVGRDLLRTFQRYTHGIQPSSETGSRLRGTVIPLFMRLSAVAAVAGNEPNIGIIASAPRQPGSDFATLDEARIALNDLTARCHTFIAQSHLHRVPENAQIPVPQDLHDHREHILASCRAWYKSFSKLMLCPVSSQWDTYTTSIHLVYYHVCTSWISTSCTPFQCAFDDWHHVFDAIVRHAKIAIEHKSRRDAMSFVSKDSKHHRPLFICDMGVIPSIFFVGRSCRHPYIRRQAIQLLKRSNMREGLWASAPVARIAEKIMEIEELNLKREDELSPMSHLPDECHRIHGTQCYEEESTDFQAHRWFIKYTQYSKDPQGMWRPSEGHSSLGRLNEGYDNDVP